MSKLALIDAVVVNDAEYDSFANALDSELARHGKCDSSQYDVAERSLAAVLAKHAEVGGIDHGDFYQADDWYGTMSFGIVLNTPALVTNAALTDLIAWCRSQATPAAVYMAGCGLQVSPDFSVAIGSGQARICWKSKGVDHCRRRLMKADLSM